MVVIRKPLNTPVSGLGAMTSKWARMSGGGGGQLGEDGEDEMGCVPVSPAGVRLLRRAMERRGPKIHAGQWGRCRSPRILDHQVTTSGLLLIQSVCVRE